MTDKNDSDILDITQLLAKKNSKDYPGMFTILFFDEANSTEAIGTIKEIMCDLRMNGKHLEENIGLKIIIRSLNTWHDVGKCA